MSTPWRLPDVRDVGFDAPFRWLADGWADLWRAPAPCLAYGALIAGLLAALAFGLYVSGLAIGIVLLALGLVLIAPILAMGPYEAGRRLEAGQTPRFSQMVLVRSALRQDAVYLGLALFLVFSFWIQAAQIVYGLSTYQLHATLPDFLRFALTTGAGQRMLLVGSLVGGAIAFGAYTLVVVSAPMLLERRFDVFMASVTSVRIVLRNPGPMLLWAVIVAVLVIGSAATGFAALIVVFPWLGLASWRAYRTLVAADTGGPPETAFDPGS